MVSVAEHARADDPAGGLEFRRKCYSLSKALPNGHEPSLAFRFENDIVLGDLLDRTLELTHLQRIAGEPFQHFIPRAHREPRLGPFVDLNDGRQEGLVGEVHPLAVEAEQIAIGNWTVIHQARERQAVGLAVAPAILPIGRGKDQGLDGDVQIEFGGAAAKA